MKFEAEVVNLKGVERDLDKMLYDIRDIASETINGALMFTVKTANMMTPKSSAYKIRMDMQIGYEGEKRYSKGEMIVRKRRKDMGLGYPTRAELDAAVKQLIKRKIETIGYLRSGWFPSIYKLIQATKNGEYSSVIKKYDVPWDTNVKLLGTTLKGGVRLAYKRIGIMTCEAWNSAGQGAYWYKAKIILNTALDKAAMKVFRKIKPFAENMMNDMLKRKRWV